jgi:serine/threonine-protein kinase HipA
MSPAHHLVVWMNGVRVGTWTEPRNGSAALQYDPEWVKAEEGRPLSLSLPFTPDNTPLRGSRVTYYFENLLPDSDVIRERIRGRFGAPSTGAFDLLKAIGRDCVGAVQLLEDGEAPTGFDRVDGKPLDEHGVEGAIDASLSPAGGIPGDETSEFRISIAGAQEKTALLRWKSRWMLPRGATPTTHIFKLPLGMVGNMQADMRDSVENEWLCSRLIAAFGLPVARCEMGEFGRRKVLIVERFDRAWQGERWIARLPQEDFCQATGNPPRQKYEVDGGPGMSDLLRILATGSAAVSDSRTFIKAQILYWMLAAVDGHAKNFSIFHERGGTHRLTPLYDVVSAWPIIGNGRNKISWHKASLAMAVRSRNTHWKLKEILPRHWDAVARAAGLAAGEIIAELISETPKAISAANAALPGGFQGRVSDAIFAGLRDQAKRLQG